MNKRRFCTHDFIRRIVRRLVIEFDDAGQATTPGLTGTAREHPARQQLERLLPSLAALGSGVIIDSDGSCSKQQDLVVYERNLCPVFAVNETPEATYYPCEGTIAIGEVKSSLDGKGLADSFGKVSSAKQLKRKFAPTTDMRGNTTVSFRNYGSPNGVIGTPEESYDQAAKWTDQVFGFILCGSFSLSNDALLGQLKGRLKETETAHSPNIILSLDNGFIVPFSHETNSIEASFHGATAFAFVENSDMGFALLLRRLNQIIRQGRTVSSEQFNSYTSLANIPPNSLTVDRIVQL